jgi:hypothetical protein
MTLSYQFAAAYWVKTAVKIFEQCVFCVHSHYK